MADLRVGHGEQLEYWSCLLRLWRVSEKGESIWRASLQNARTGERMGFASLEALYDYLRAEIGLEETGQGIKEEERQRREDLPTDERRTR